MGVAMEQKLRPRRCMAGRNMDQMKTMAEALQFQAHRPVGLVILISTDDKHLGSKILNRLQGYLFTDITKMPDLIRPPDGPKQGGEESVVGIGNDSDAKRISHLVNGGNRESWTNLPRMPANRPFDSSHK